MLYTVPDYYKKFHCLAGECPATCCAGWQIVIDQKSLHRYAAEKGAFGNRLRNSVNWKEHTFLQYRKRCAFLNEENLCDIHIEGGAAMMCATCRKYPRHVEVFDNEREISLSMSCPAAARLILGNTSRVAFRSAEDEKQDEADESFDSFLYSALQDSRTLFFEMLQNRETPVFLRMAKVLALAHDIQNRINSGKIFEIGELLEKYRRELQGGSTAAGEKRQSRLTQKIMREAGGFDGTASGDAQICKALAEERQIFRILQELETLDKDWLPDAENWKHVLAAVAADAQGQKEITAFFSENVIPQTEYEQMTVYYLYTYFCGAVYDGEALAKVKAAVVSTLLWAWACCAQWLPQGKQLSFEDRLRIAWRYSRELEHSDVNLNRMDEMANARDEMAFARLMKTLAVLARKSEL